MLRNSEKPCEQGGDHKTDDEGAKEPLQKAYESKQAECYLQTV